MGWHTVLSLDDQLGAFVESEVARGRYDDPAEVVRAALRLLKERDAGLEDLRQALQEGERSGVPTPFDFDAFMKRKRGPD